MKISTKNTRVVKRGGNTSQNRRKAPAGSRTSRKPAKNRVSTRRILSYARKIGWLVAVALVMGFLYWIGTQAYHSENFQVRDIEVYGCNELDPQIVKQIVRENIPGNILDIEMVQLKECLEEIQWIHHVEIRRVLPSGLIIHVHERIPSVILQMQGNLMVADRDGILLDRHGPRYGKLDMPVFKGIVGKDVESYNSYQQENSIRVRNALKMLEEIQSGEPQYMQKISEVDIADTNNLKIILVDDTSVISLGNKNFFKRLQSLLNSIGYRKMKEENVDILEVDMRNEHQITFTSNQATVISSPAD